MVLTSFMQTLTMSLYQSNPVGSISGSLTSVFYDLAMASGNMSYDWVVPNVTVNTGE